MRAAKNKALDHLRHLRMQVEKLAQIGHELEVQEALVVPDFVDALDAARQDEIGDDLLRHFHGMPSCAVNRGAGRV